MKFFSAAIFFLFSITISAQRNTLLASPDSVSNFVADSTLADSSAIEKKNDIDAVVNSSASDSLIFDVKKKLLHLYGNGGLKYKDMGLKSGAIDLDFNTSDLLARGREKRISEDSVDHQNPVLTEGRETYQGHKIKYNFNTGQGFISMAKNVKEDKSYIGEKVKKVDKTTFFIEDGIYTTCPADTPHTYFQAEKMKVIQNDKIIAKWVFMYVGGVPLPIPLPFGVFPNETGRRSGIIIPSFGSSGTRGQYFQNFGYFFALSDYFDLTLNGDYYTKGGYAGRARARYKKRYELSGNINAGFSRIIIGESEDPSRTERTDWNLGVNHNQTLTPTSRLVVNLNFQSSSYLRNNSISLNDQLTRNITSNATFSKRWDGSGNSITLNYSRTQNLDNGNITESLPNVSFNMPVLYPFKSAAGGTGRNWYEKFGINYSANLRNTRRKTEGDLKIRGGFRHSFSANLSPKIGYFSITPRLSYNEKWYNKRVEKEVVVIPDSADAENTTYHDSVITKDVHEISAVRTFDFSIGATTKLYGMAQPKIFGIEAFRHTMTPSISYSYSPDFSDKRWGYYDEITRLDGTVERYDRYEREIFGGASKGERQMVNFALDNLFEIKTMKDPTDTTSQQEKIRLLNLRASTSYNFARDSLNLSDMSVSFRTQIGDLLNISGSSSYTFYDVVGGRQRNQFLASLGKGLLRLTNLRFSISSTISGEKIKKKFMSAETELDKQDFENEASRDYFIGPYDVAEADFSIPWDLSLNYNYSMNKFNPENIRKSSNVGIGGSINLTPNWKIKIRGNYDFDNDLITAPQVTIYRELHCWEMNFTWNPLGAYRGFRFEIRLKSPELQDIKIEKSGGLYTGFRGGY